MNDFLQDMGVKFYKNPMGYSAYVNTAQYNAIWRTPGVVIVEARRDAISVYNHRVTWGFYVRWLYIEQEAKAAA